MNPSATPMHSTNQASQHTPGLEDGERIAANAALLRLFRNEYRESSDRHSDSLFVRDYVQVLEQAHDMHLRILRERQSLIHKLQVEGQTKDKARATQS